MGFAGVSLDFDHVVEAVQGTIDLIRTHRRIAGEPPGLRCPAWDHEPVWAIQSAAGPPHSKTWRSSSDCGQRASVWSAAGKRSATPLWILRTWPSMRPAVPIAFRRRSKAPSPLRSAGALPKPGGASNGSWK